MSILKSGLRAMAVSSFIPVGIFLGIIGIGFTTIELRVLHHRFGEAYDRFVQTGWEERYCSRPIPPSHKDMCAERNRSLNQKLEDGFEGFTADYNTLLFREYLK